MEVAQADTVAPARAGGDDLRPAHARARADRGEDRGRRGAQLRLARAVGQEDVGVDAAVRGVDVEGGHARRLTDGHPRAQVGAVEPPHAGVDLKVHVRLPDVRPLAVADGADARVLLQAGTRGGQVLDGDLAALHRHAAGLHHDRLRPLTGGRGRHDELGAQPVRYAPGLDVRLNADDQSVHRPGQLQVVLDPGRSQRGGGFVDDGPVGGGDVVRARARGDGGGERPLRRAAVGAEGEIRQDRLLLRRHQEGLAGGGAGGGVRVRQRARAGRPPEGLHGQGDAAECEGGAEDRAGGEEADLPPSRAAPAGEGAGGGPGGLRRVLLLLARGRRALLRPVRIRLAGMGRAHGRTLEPDGGSPHGPFSHCRTSAQSR